MGMMTDIAFDMLKFLDRYPYSRVRGHFDHMDWRRKETAAPWKSEFLYLRIRRKRFAAA